MVEIFRHVSRFFSSLTTNYLTYNHIFIIFVGLFIVTILGVVFFTSRSYETRLIKAIDKLNSYFIDNPYINDDNLVAFNERMKSNLIPKQLRKHWQQFVLYRENKASTYMSFENCVSNPIRNSTYTRDVKLMGMLAWIFSLLALVLNCFHCYETVDIAESLRGIILTPVVILLLNYFVQIFLNLRHSAIVSDLFQNYQYFELNIDKATSTLPEYVDYEVLFDKNEIKRGIPILYAYLQKRAEEEQRELERARLKNVEHDKFNFDDQGIARSLVLERAMQEAENYIAERKKYNQDIAQINADITQEDMNYREITKEYNRQMQVSKESFANFKAQLEEATSTIAANYLKKQQQQELDRQRNLERDFDAATERHKKVIDSYNEELDTVDKFIAESRKTLEEAMKSEFETYNSKVYDEAKKVVDEREKEKYQKLKENINNLEEDLHGKTKELETIYQTNQELNEKVADLELELQAQAQIQQKPKGKKDKFKSLDNHVVNEVFVPETVVEEPKPVEEEQSVQTEEAAPTSYEEYRKRFETSSNTEDENPDEEAGEEITPEFIDNLFDKFENPQQDEEFEDDENLEESDNSEFDQFNFEEDSSENDQEEDEISTEETDDSIQNEDQEALGETPESQETEEVKVERRKAGRPRKVVDPSQVKPKRGVGRPRKVVDPTAPTAPKRGRGRPKKDKDETEEVKPTRGRGRPRKNDVDQPINDIQDIDAYLKEIDNAIAQENAKLEETQKELAKQTKIKRKK